VTLQIGGDVFARMVIDAAAGRLNR
jgi:hypothetical protein